MNRLCYGDNLTIMREMPAESVDLTYLDPPFNSNRSYNLLYKNTTGLPVPEQIEAFCDTWELDYEKTGQALDIPRVMQEYGLPPDAVRFWRHLVEALMAADTKLLAYLVYMTVRLIETYRLLKKTGSLYLHCDPAASHYLKIILDGIFGHENFCNEIVWSYKRYTTKSARLQKLHDIILWYSKDKGYVFNEPREAYGEKSGKADSHYRQDEDGKWFRWQKRRGREPYKIYLSEGKRMGDVWEIPIINASARERLGYPTQKPLALLERLILMGSREGGVVFDPFCGCGTAIEAAIKNNRRWIGCDIAIHTIKLIQDARIKKYGLVAGKDYTIEGVPQSAEQARCLFEQDPFQFQHWAVERTGGFCSNKKSGDRGVDGKIYFEADGRLCSMVLSVKGGAIDPADIRDLRGVLERECGASGASAGAGVEMAGFISLEPPASAVAKEADHAGLYEYRGERYPRIQLLTIQDIFDGKRWHCPSIVKTTQKDSGQPCLSL